MSIETDECVCDYADRNDEYVLNNTLTTFFSDKTRLKLANPKCIRKTKAAAMQVHKVEVVKKSKPYSYSVPTPPDKPRYPERISPEPEPSSRKPEESGMSLSNAYLSVLI